MTGPDGQGRYTVLLKPFQGQAKVVDFVLHYEDNTWDNNGGGDYHITLSDSTEPSPDAGTGTDAATDSSVDSDTGSSQDSAIAADGNSDSSVTSDTGSSQDSAIAADSNSDSSVNSDTGSSQDSGTAADSSANTDSGFDADSNTKDTSTADGSAAKDAEAAAATAPSDDGCSCRQGPNGKTNGHWLIAAAGLAIAWVMRKRSH